MLTVSRAATLTASSLNDAARATSILSQKLFDPSATLNWLIPPLKKGGRGDFLKRTDFQIPLTFSKGEVRTELVIRSSCSAWITGIVGSDRIQLRARRARRDCPAPFC